MIKPKKIIFRNQFNTKIASYSNTIKYSPTIFKPFSTKITASYSSHQSLVPSHQEKCNYIIVTIIIKGIIIDDKKSIQFNVDNFPPTACESIHRKRFIMTNTYTEDDGTENSYDQLVSLSRCKFLVPKNHFEYYLNENAIPTTVRFRNRDYRKKIKGYHLEYLKYLCLFTDKNSNFDTYASSILKAENHRTFFFYFFLVAGIGIPLSSIILIAFNIDTLKSFGYDLSESHIPIFIYMTIASVLYLLVRNKIYARKII